MSKGLGVGERLEQAAFLRFEREDREERHGDDQEAEEQRRPDLARRVDDDLCTRLPGRSALEVFVRVLDHDDRRVDHRANGYGDAAKAHDVRA
jgi:hypothetical protein